MTWRLLAQFALRLTFGVALAMGATPPRWVASGFYRVHLWVLLGLATLASLALYSERAATGDGGWALSLAIAVAVVSYVGSVLWLYERPAAGQAAVWIACGAALAGCVAAGPGRPSSWVGLLDAATSGLLMGSVTTAMLLGHWYLNAPGMRLEPLRRLLLLSAAAVLLRAAVCGAGWAFGGGAEVGAMWALFRWAIGIGMTGCFVFLAWRTLQVPNTQSATGILYAAVIVVLLGELLSELLSAGRAFPL